MNTHSQPLNERLSALMDGELPASELDALLHDLAQQESSVHDWHLYHLAGDVLRNPTLAPQPADLAFLGRLEQRLGPQCAVSAVQPAPALLWPAPTGLNVGPRMAVAANGPWRWVAGSVFTVLVGVVSVGLWWSAAPPAVPQWVTAPATAPTAVAQEGPAVMLRDPELDALMAAHQQLGGHSAWQMPSGFLRNATFERSAR